MNHLQELIHSNSNWKEILDNKAITIKEDQDLLLFKYQSWADFSDPVVRDCRGIILDKDFNVVCYPFDKFGNYFEPYVPTIDWSTARVQEKVDGSIIKLFYHNEWRWSTNGTIDARACESQKAGKSFYELITDAENYSSIDFSSLDKDTTYIFELVGPDNQIVVHYDRPYLYHIGTRRNSGLEVDVSIGIEKPKEYALRSFEETLSAVSQLNKTNVVEHEGFVVVDKNYNRVKIKNAEYLMLHKLANNGQLSKDKILDLILSDDFDEKEIIGQYPHYEEMLNYYKDEIKRVEQDVHAYVAFVRSLSGDRKQIANTIKNDEYAFLGFKALGNEKSAKTLLAELTPKRYYALIREQ